MDLASVLWGTRRAIHLRGRMWMARQFDLSGLIALARSASDIANRLIEAISTKGLITLRAPAAPSRGRGHNLPITVKPETPPEHRL